MRLKRTFQDVITVSDEDREALYLLNLQVLGERLRRARIEKKVSQRELCEGLFTSAYLSSLELGKTRPTFETLSRLARRLDKSVDFFLKPAPNRNSELDEEYSSILDVQLALLTAQTALAKAADQRAEKALEQVALHLARLSSFEKSHYYYLRGKYRNMRQEPLVALAELEEARRYLQTGSEPSQQSLIENELGQAYFLQRRNEVALNHYLAALEPLSTTKENPGGNLRWKILVNIANCYLAMENREKSMSFFHQAVEEATISIVADQQAAAYYNRTLFYGEQGNFQRACLQLGQMLQIYEQAGTHLRLAYTHNTLAQGQIQLGQYDQAENQATQALRLAQLGQINDTSQEMAGLVTLAIVNYKRQKLIEAEGYISQALQLAETCNNISQLGRLYQTAAEIVAELGPKETAEHYYQQGLMALEASEMTPQVADLYHSYGQRLRKWGEVERAFTYLERAYQLREGNRAESEAAPQYLISRTGSSDLAQLPLTSS
jgi:tetratricopeptide (TPR) repeat protein